MKRILIWSSETCLAQSRAIPASAGTAIPFFIDRKGGTATEKKKKEGKS